jgi:predicted GNAT family N-acyltransferase
MATVAARRNEGIGGLLLAAVVREVLACGGRLLWCQARDSAIRFYARHGFLGEGEHFVQAETGIMHQLMYRELAGVFDSSDVVS